MCLAEQFGEVVSQQLDCPRCKATAINVFIVQSFAAPST